MWDILNIKLKKYLNADWLVIIKSQFRYYFKRIEYAYNRRTNIIIRAPS